MKELFGMSPEQFIATNIFHDFLSAIKSNYPELLFAFILTGVFIALTLVIIKSLSGYIIFTLNKRLSIGITIKLRDGRLGAITDYTVFAGVVVRTEEDTYITIPWDEWKGSYETLGKDFKGNRRKKDLVGGRTSEI